MTTKLEEIDEMAKLIEQARALGPMTDEQRREQAASFAFGNLALTSAWSDKPADELARLRETCRRMAGCAPSESEPQITDWWCTRDGCDTHNAASDETCRKCKRERGGAT